MHDTHTTFLIAVFLFSGIILIHLCLNSFKQRNAYFERHFKPILILSILGTLTPPILIFVLLQNTISPGVKQWEESVHREWEKTKYITDIELNWNATEVTGEPFLKDLGKTLEARLNPANKHSHGHLFDVNDQQQVTDEPPSILNKLVYSISNDLDKNGVGPVTTIKLFPQSVFPDSPELKSILSAIYPQTPKDLSTGFTTDSVSIRSVHPGQERLAASGYPPAPTGYAQLPWKDGFIYVSDGFHINESHITHAERYGKDGIMATVSPEGQIKMMTMARKLSQIEVSVAVLLNDAVRGTYSPSPSITDQFFITSIPFSAERIDAIANSLSMPNKWGPSMTTKLHFNTPSPDPDAFSTLWWQFIKHHVLPQSYSICFAIFFLMMLISFSIMGIYHFKTKNCQ